MISRSPVSIRCAALLALTTFGASAHAIVGGTDDLANSVYQYMGTIGKSASFPGYGATPISSNWLVSANHIASEIGVGKVYTSPEGTFNVVETRQVGTSDLLLVRIDNGSTGKGLTNTYGYSSLLTPPVPVTLVGSGRTGNATSTGYTLNTSSYPAVRQVAQNTIDLSGTIDFNGGQTFVYLYDLDGKNSRGDAVNSIGGTAVTGEGGLADKDSGSGWFVNIGGRTVVAAISTAVGDNSQATGNGTTNNFYDYGDVGFGTALGAYSSEITRITGVAPVPEPAPMTALGLGALALLRRRRK